MMQRAVELDELLFGPSHPRLAESLASLGTMFEEAHDTARARATLERAVAIERATGGRIRPRTSAAVATLARMLEVGAEAPRAQLEAGSRPLRFAERWDGRLTFAAGDAPIALMLEVAVEDVDRLLEANGSGVLTGRVECDALGGVCRVRYGSLDIRGDAADYELHVESEDQPAFVLRARRALDEVAPEITVHVATGDGRAADGRARASVDVLEAVPSPALDRFARAYRIGL
jgi:hypothetical protein